jgi:hypothetical protein
MASATDPSPTELADVELSDVEEEDSVVVLHRKSEGPPATPPASEGADVLEPISEISEYEPELADPEPASRQSAESSPTDGDSDEQEAAEFGAGLREVAPVKVAKLPNDVAKDYREPTPVEPTRFHGIQPGVSTTDELLKAWGKPEETEKTPLGNVLRFKIAPFASVEAQVEKNVVRSIRVELQNQEEHRDLAAKLRLDAVETVEILDDRTGSAVGIAYPERGVLLLLAPAKAKKSPQFISHLILQELKADAFTLRAENHLHGPYEKNLSDLERALVLDPDNAQALWLLSEIHLATGQVASGETAAAKAFEIEPENEAYRLRWARALDSAGRYDEAVLETRKILDNESAPQIVRAQALHQMGRLASQGDAKVADKAIGFHTLAIEAADKLAQSEDARERRAALEVLLDAHLAVAREVARRDYDNKIETVSQWIARASGLAEEMIANEGGELELRLRVAEQALGALASLKPTKDPEPWIKEAQETADAMLAESIDTLWRQRINWQIGSAYYHAVRIEHTRQQPDKALAYGQSAIKYLADGAKLRDMQPEAEELVGLLYFHLGAVHAVYKQDHAKAVTWYEKAVPFLSDEQVTPVAAIPRRQGEALVSMAVSYWQQGDKQQALELTEMGADLIEKAVAGGVMNQEVLAVPYGNLATMHKLLGNTSESAKYAELEKNARATDSPRTDRGELQQPTASRTRSRSAMRPTQRNTQRMIRR